LHFNENPVRFIADYERPGGPDAKIADAGERFLQQGASTRKWQ
jgi:hypothetical protein